MKKNTDMMLWTIALLVLTLAVQHGVIPNHPLVVICIGAADIVFGVHYQVHLKKLAALTSRPYFAERVTGSLMIAVGALMVFSPVI